MPINQANGRKRLSFCAKKRRCLPQVRALYRREKTTTDHNSLTTLPFDWTHPLTGALFNTAETCVTPKKEAKNP